MVVPSLLSDTVGASVKPTLATWWWLSSWWVQGPTEGSLYSGSYSHSSSRELCVSPSFRMSPDSVISECSCSSPSKSRHSASDTEGHFGPEASSFKSGRLQHTHSVPHICSPQSAHTYPCRISELTAPPTPDTPGLILPSGYLVRHTSFGK